MWGVSLIHPVLPSFLCGEFLLRIPCCLDFYGRTFSYTSRAGLFWLLGSFSYTSRAGFIFIRRVSVTHPKLASFLSLEYHLHIPCWPHFYLWSFLYIPCLLSFYVGSFSYTSQVGFYFSNLRSLAYTKSWGVSLTDPVLASFFSAEFIFSITCWLHFYVGSFSYTSHADYFYVRSFSYTSGAAFLLCVKFPLHVPCSLDFYEGVSLTYSVFIPFFIVWVSLTHPVLGSFLSREFLLHFPFWLHFYRGIFSYTSRAGFSFSWGVSLTHHILASFLSGEFLLHKLCWFHFYLGSFSYTSHAGFIFIWEFLWEFLLNIPCWLHFYMGSFSYTSHADFAFMWGVSLTHPMLASFILIYGVSRTRPVLASVLFVEVLLSIPCWLDLHVGSFSDISHDEFIFVSGVSLIHPVLPLRSFSYTSPADFILSGEFLLRIPCFLQFYLWSFSYTSLVGLTFVWGVSLTHPKLASFSFFLSAEFSLHIPCWLYFYLGFLS